MTAFTAIPFVMALVLATVVRAECTGPGIARAEAVQWLALVAIGGILGFTASLYVQVIQ